MDSIQNKIEELRRDKKPFAVAVVIHVKGSASARPGSKAIIDESGKNIMGWVGGGCAEAFVGNQAVEAMKEKRTRIVQADLDDEIFGLGMPCGGIMDVFIEPYPKPERLRIEDCGELNPMLSHLAGNMGFEHEFVPSRSKNSKRDIPPVEQGLETLAQALIELRGTDGKPLNPEAQAGVRVPAQIPEFLVLGTSRITEELAKLAVIAHWPVRVFGPNLDPELYPKQVHLETAVLGQHDLQVKKDSVVIVASHHKGDHDFIRQSLAAGASYIGMIASHKRSKLVLDYLRNENKLPSEEVAKVSAPSGLNLNCQTPAEIALSVLAEVISLRGKP